MGLHRQRPTLQHISNSRGRKHQRETQQAASGRLFKWHLLTRGCDELVVGGGQRNVRHPRLVALQAGRGWEGYRIPEGWIQEVDA